MALKTNSIKIKNNHGFTIVELLVVIVVIGILAAITITSYVGVTKKANESTIQSDLSNNKKKIDLYHAEHGVYPTSLDSNKCPTNTTQTPNTDTNYCLKSGSGTNVTFNSDSNGTNYTLKETNGDIAYSVTNNRSTAVTVKVDSNWLVIGSQTWAAKNLNIGTRINTTVAQTNNGGTDIVEKYCYDNLESNCDTYGALYLGNEAMKYTTNEGSQGICQVGSHIPTDSEWKILEMQLGMTQSEADAFSVFRGIDQATQLIDGGSSGFGVLFSGLRNSSGQSSSYQSMGSIWSSTIQNGNNNILFGRSFFSGVPKVFRNAWSTDQGFSVRCLAN